MTRYAIPVPATPSLAIVGSDARFPIHRIYCVGRNFADHAKEMGAEVPRGRPVFFMKPADAVVPDGGDVRYPTATHDLHHEVELVVAIGRDAEGVVPVDRALEWVFGYGVGLDLTRRDLQAEAKDRRLPWDTAKGFDQSAPASALVPAARCGLPTQRLWLRVNDSLRQHAPLTEMVFGVADIIHELSQLFALRAGDLIFMGTPAGVAALQPGDSFVAGIDDLIELRGRVINDR